MGFLERLEVRAAAAGGRVALAEGHDQRIVDAAGDLLAGGCCEVTLVCPAEQRQPIHEELTERGIEVADAERVIRSLAVHGNVPEPLRAAHLIAGGIARGQSRGRT